MVPVAAARVLQEPLASLVFEYVDVAGYCPCCSDFDDFDMHVCDEMSEDRYCAVCGYDVHCAAPNDPLAHRFGTLRSLAPPYPYSGLAVLLASVVPHTAGVR